MQQCKKVITTLIKIIGFIVLALLLIINILQISQVVAEIETVEISFVSLKMHLLTILCMLLIFGILLINRKFKIINLNNKKIVISILVIYAFICYKWINYQNIVPVADSLNVYDLAKTIIKYGTISSIQGNLYLEQCPQQIFMTIFFALIFKLTSSTSFLNIQFLNIIANIFIILGIYKLTKLLTKNNKKCAEISFFLTITFFPLIFICNFVYSDFISLALAIWGIAYMLIYNQNQKIKYFILSSVLLLIAFLLKTNFLIIIIACFLYLVIKALDKETKKERLKFVGIIAMFLGICFIPYFGLKQLAYSNLNLKYSKAIPTSGYIYMGMIESPREAGWWSIEAMEEAQKNTKKSREIYPDLINKRLKEFSEDKIYILDFYRRKITSGWADPTFQSIWYGISYIEKDAHLNSIFQSTKYKALIGYMRAVVICIFMFSLIGLIINRKKTTDEQLLFYIIFLGGFCFHFLWEMKSRYVMSYVIILIPIASIIINQLLEKIEIKLKKKEIKNERKS